MKNFTKIITAIILIVLAGCSSQSSSKQDKVSVIAQKYAPENSMVMLRFSSIGKLFSTFNLKPESVMGEPVVEDRTELINLLGFDPMNLTEYERIGFDTKREFGFVMTNFVAEGNDLEKTQVNFAFLVPIKQNSNAFGYIKDKLIANKNEKISVSEVDGMLTVQSTEEQNFLATIKADSEYMIFNFAVNSQETADLFLNTGKHLADSQNYKEVANAVNLSSDIAFYMDFKPLMVKNEKSLQDMALNPQFSDGQIKSMDFLKYYRGYGISTDLSSTDLKVSAVTFIDTENPLNKIIKDAKIDKSVILGFEKKPALLLCLLVNAGEYMNFILETLPLEMKLNFEANLKNYKDMLGIDLREDFINELGGSINFGIYDASTINLMQYNTVLNFNIKNRIKFIDTLQKIAGLANMEKLSGEAVSGMMGNKKLSGNTDVYSINLGMSLLYVIIDENNVSLCTSKDLSIDIMDKSNTVFVDIMEKSVADKLKNDQNYFYLDLNEAYTAAKTIYQFFIGISGGENVLDATTDNFVTNFDYLYAGGNFIGDKAAGEFVVKTKFTKPFFIALQEEVKKLNIIK